MIDLKFLEKLIRLLDESGLDHVEIQRGATRIRVSRTPSVTAEPERAPAPSSEGAEGSEGSGSAPPSPASESTGSPADAPPTAVADLSEVRSPMVGTFYRAPSPTDDPFTDVGDRISKGDPLCIIEAMKLMNEMESEVDGIVREICVANGEPVEYGQVLFRVESA